MLAALGMAVIFISIIRASLFGAFLQPLATMLALPRSFIRVALALLSTRGNLNVFTMIGIIMLMGLVTKNGIQVVDFANQQREEGMGRREALLSAGHTRLRPIIMTTIMSACGLCSARSGPSRRSRKELDTAPHGGAATGWRSIRRGSWSA